MCSAPRKLFRTLLGTDFPHGSAGKEPACQGRRHRRHGFRPWVGEVPWGRRWQPTPVFLPEKSHGQRRLQTTAQSHKESDAHTHTHTHTHAPHLYEVGATDTSKRTRASDLPGPPRQEALMAPYFCPWAQQHPRVVWQGCPGPPAAKGRLPLFSLRSEGLSSPRMRPSLATFSSCQRQKAQGPHKTTPVDSVLCPAPRFVC